MTARHDFDFYATPPGFARAALAQLPTDFTPCRALDPGAGTGVWGRAIRERYPAAQVTGVEIRDVPKPPEYTHWHNGSFAYFGQRGFDLIAGNPPFSDAEMFVRQALPMLSDGGFLMYLLRLNFIAAQGRAEGLWRETPLWKMVVASRRVNFLGEGNMHDCALFIWQCGYTGPALIDWMIHEDNEPELVRAEYQRALPQPVPLF